MLARGTLEGAVRAYVARWLQAQFLARRSLGELAKARGAHGEGAHGEGAHVRMAPQANGEAPRRAHAMAVSTARGPGPEPEPEGGGGTPRTSLGGTKAAVQHLPLAQFYLVFWYLLARAFWVFCGLKYRC